MVIWTTDTDLQFTSIQGDYASVLGMENAQSVFELFQSEDPLFRPVAEILRALAGETVHFETRLEDREIIVAAKPLESERRDRVVGTVGILYDTTDQHMLSERLLASEQRYGALFDHTRDPVFLFKLDGSLLRLNASARTLTGYRLVELDGRSVFELVVQEHRERILELIREQLGGRAQSQFEADVITAAGGRHPMRFSTRLLFEHGMPSLIQAIAKPLPQD
jgi:PAS domain S-box-containing protein